MKLEQVELGKPLQDIVHSMADKPGIYIFCNEDKILYVGKARNLRKRVSSYMKDERLDNKSRLMMANANRLKWVITASNKEALLLEYNFIKKHKPPYNILLRDDKSYPFVYLSNNHDFPLLSMHRGPQKKKGKYYGPYPNAGAVHRSISELQKIFQIRSCSDSFFSNRVRPCLQHQIGRCTAPCVDAISQEDYAKNVNFVADFLSGKDGKVLRELTKAMQQASNDMKFEEAAALRDKVQAMRNLSEKQYVTRSLGDLDALAVYSHGNSACVYVVKVRKGNIGDSQHFFFRAPAFNDEDTLLESFINYYYLSSNVTLPSEIITSQPLKQEVFDDLEEHYGRKIHYKHQVRGDRRRWLNMAYESCKSLLVSHLNDSYRLQEELDELGRKFSLAVSRIECFDISHSSGSQTQASCVV
ncbi:MAG: excinuclease ABC subunit UvrC, partial [Candidatus Portiera sp.]|nr:excinuclease ABC subunit UvrC [Portiera sp.]